MKGHPLTDDQLDKIRAREQLLTEQQSDHQELMDHSTAQSDRVIAKVFERMDQMEARLATKARPKAKGEAKPKSTKAKLSDEEKAEKDRKKAEADERKAKMLALKLQRDALNAEIKALLPPAKRTKKTVEKPDEEITNGKKLVENPDEEIANDKKPVEKPDEENDNYKKPVEKPGDEIANEKPVEKPNEEDKKPDETKASGDLAIQRMDSDDNKEEEEDEEEEHKDKKGVLGNLFGMGRKV